MPPARPTINVNKLATISDRQAIPKALSDLDGAFVTGEAVLVGGTKTINTEEITAESEIIHWRKSSGGTPGFVDLANVTPGAPGSFDLVSSSGSDTSTIGYMIVG